MMEEEQAIVKDALEFIKATGGTGVLKTRLFDAVRNADGSRLTLEEQDAIFSLLVKRGWIEYHLDQLWHNKRWCLTERGLTAYEGMC